MTKTEFQAELKEKLKKGIKPSDLKKSKSLDDLTPKNLLYSEPLRRKSIEPLTNPNSLKKQLESARDEISALGLQVEISQRELAEFKAENTHLKEQAKFKQKEVEGLREQLETLNQELKETKQTLDHSLEARYNSLKVFDKEHDKRIKTEQELNETIEEASTELKAGDNQVNSLRTKLFSANQQINKLERELKLERIKRSSSPNNLTPEDNFLTNLKYALYALLTVWFLVLLNQRKPQNPTWTT